MSKKLSTVILIILIIFVVLVLIVFFYPKKSGEVVWGSATQKCKCFGLAHTPYTQDTQQTKCYGIPYSCQYPTIRCNKDSECVGIKIAMSLQCKENEDVTNYCSGPGVCALKCVSRVRGVTVITDKTEYQVGEEVKITVTNNTSQKIGFEPGSSPAFDTSRIYRKNPNGEWDIIYINLPEPTIPPQPETRDWSVILDTREQYSYTWDQKSYNSTLSKRVQVPIGIYRVQQQWYYPKTNNGGTANSNEFTIKATVNQNLNVNYSLPDIKIQEGCEALGAHWTATGAIARVCEFSSPDAGNVCTKASDCMRGCRIEDAKDKTGICSEYSLGGCYWYLDDDGNAQGICID